MCLKELFSIQTPVTLFHFIIILLFIQLTLLCFAPAWWWQMVTDECAVFVCVRLMPPAKLEPKNTNHIIKRQFHSFISTISYYICYYLRSNLFILQLIISLFSLFFQHIMKWYVGKTCTRHQLHHTWLHLENLKQCRFWIQQTHFSALPRLLS